MSPHAQSLALDADPGYRERVPSFMARGWARGRRLAGWLLGCALIACFGSAVRAQEQVLLLAPETPEPVLIELYHRLEAELHIHGFDTVTLVSAAPEDGAGAMLGAQASARGAMAAIAVVLRNRNAALDVWLVDPDTGRASVRTLSASAGDETANLVAVRAVDLLRASLAARAQKARAASAPQKPPPPLAAVSSPRKTSAAVGGTPTNVSAATRREPAAQPEEAESTAEPPTPTRPTPLLTFRVEALGIWQGNRFGVGLGPALGAGVRLLDALKLVATAAGTRNLQQLETALGTAQVQQEHFGLELELRLAAAGRLQLSAAGGAGVMLLQADGHPISTLAPGHGAQWSWQLLAGPRVALALSDQWSLTAALRARVYLPDVVVAVSTESARLGRPSLDAALGLAFSP